MNSIIVDPSHVAISARLTLWAADAEVRREWLAECLLRHGSGDWGELDDEDRAANNHALRRSLRRSSDLHDWLALAG